jgi:hypothetical protein
VQQCGGRSQRRLQIGQWNLGDLSQRVKIQIIEQRQRFSRGGLTQAGQKRDRQGSEEGSFPASLHVATLWRSEKRGGGHARHQLVACDPHDTGQTMLSSRFPFNADGCVHGWTEQTACAREIQKDMAGLNRFPHRRVPRDDGLNVVMSMANT